VRSLCTLLAALVPLAASGAEPETGAEAGRAFIVRDKTGERLEVAAQLVFDHRASATATGAPRLQPVHWKPDATAALTTPDGAFDATIKLERTDVGTVSKWLSANGWTVITSEIGYLPKMFPELTDEQRQEVGEFLQALDEHDDVHRVWADFDISDEEMQKLASK